MFVTFADVWYTVSFRLRNFLKKSWEPYVEMQTSDSVFVEAKLLCNFLDLDQLYLTLGLYLFHYL